MTSSLVDESVLLNQMSKTRLGKQELKKRELVDQFRYFVIDNSILLALLEDPLENEQGQPLELKSSNERILTRRCFSLI